MSESENPVIDAPEPKPQGRPRTNQDWWPNQLDLQVLHQHSPKGNPMGEDFDYRKAFAELDVEELRKDVLARATHPRNVELAMDSDARLQGDEAMVQSAFSNLVDNAAKYTPSEGSMLIRWWTDGEGAHFSVRDTGPGIPAEHLPRLTERFYRVDPARSRETGGSGLGLAIVKHALHRHGGSLDIESIPGRGSTFTCHFPPERILERRVAASA